MRNITLLAGLAPFRLNRGSLPFVRAFASERKQHRATWGGGQLNIALNPRQITSPATKRWGKGMDQAKDYRSDSSKRLIAREPSASSVRDEGHHFSKWLWRLAHPIPLSKRSPWIGYPIYLVVGFYSSLFLLWFFSRDQVPITGRWRFKCLPVENPQLLEDGNTSMVVDAGGEGLLSSDDDPRLLRLKQTRSVLDRVLSASGLSHLEWNLMVIDTPGQCTLPDSAGIK